MSDLSFLIQNQNQVQIDQSYLQKCQQNLQLQTKIVPSSIGKVNSSRDLKLNRSKNLIATKKKVGSPRSYNIENKDNEMPNQNLAKLSIRIQALQQNQKRMQKRIGIQFFQLKQQIQKRNLQQNDQFQEVKRMKSSLNETKKNIAQLLSMISKRK